MELKIRDQYTYFIHTFVLKENKYIKYVQKKQLLFFRY